MRNGMALRCAYGSTNAVHLGVGNKENKRQQAKHMYQDEQQIRANVVIIIL